MFWQLVDAGAIDAIELFMRTSLSDSTIAKAFVEIQFGVEELGDVEEITPPRDLETPTEIAITEKLNATTNVIGRVFWKLPGSES